MAKIIIGIADMKASADSSDIMTTYCLGSCIGLSIYDPVVKVGGILHYMLPSDLINPLIGWTGDGKGIAGRSGAVMKQMDEILASIHQIPPFPQVVIKAMDIISNPQYIVSC